MSHRCRVPFWAIAFFVAQISMVNCDILLEGLIAESDVPLLEAGQPALKQGGEATALVEEALQVAGTNSASGASSSRLRSGRASAAREASRSALKLDAGGAAPPSSHGAMAHTVDRLFNSSMLQVRSLSKRWPEVFAQVPMHAGIQKTSWLGSMAMILVVSGTVIFMVLLLFAFQEKVKKEYEPEKQPSPPLQFLRNNPEAAQNFGRRAGSTLQVPLGPASTSSVVSHMRDPRFAAGADQKNQEVKEGSGAPWA